MREKNGLVLNIIGLYFLFSVVAGLIAINDIKEAIALDGLFNNSAVGGVYWFVMLTNMLITFSLLYTGIRRYILYRRDKKEYQEKQKKKEKKKK